MNEVGISIIGTECKSACQGEPDFETRVRKAMAVVANGHWMFCQSHEEDLRFRGALAGVLMAPETTADEKDQIKDTLDSLRAFNAMLTSVPVNLEAMTERLEDNPPLPLMRWWNEAKGQRAA